MPERPPAKAPKKNSGKIIDGSNRAGFVTKLWMLRHATARATPQNRCRARGHVRTRVVRRLTVARLRKTAIKSAEIPNARPSASQSKPTT